jgi:hypothetical protein
MVSISSMNDTQETHGVLYVATGKKYIQSAIRSARSVRKHNPGFQIHLFANWEECGVDFNHSREPFTSIESIDAPHSRSTVDYSIRTPFDRTLYLDTDTRVLDDISPLFDLLDRFDIAAAHAPNRITRLMNWRVPVPISFPQFNCGVLLYKRSEKVMKFLQDWIDAFHQAGFLSDQITFRELVWLSDLRIATLAQEYNLRQLKYFLVWGGREARPKILHLAMFHQNPFWVLRRSVKALLRR